MTEEKPIKRDFDLEVVLRGFRSCCREDGTLGTQDYLHGFRELCRFFRLMGRVFGFVATDLQSRINTIEKHVKGIKRESYETIQAMVAYETEEHLSSNSGSGSQNLLELHRALEFISEFMDKISVASDDAKTADIASEVYTYTLGTHHNWVVRKMAVVAMYTLPRRRELIEKMCKHDLEHVDSLLRDVVDAMMPVYSKTDKVLTEHHIS